MIRDFRVSVFILSILTASCLAAGEDGRYSHPLPTPPLVALKADSIGVLRALGKAQHVNYGLAAGGRKGWRELSGLGVLPPASVIAALESVSATRVSLCLLPPTTPPNHVLLTAQVAGVDGKAADLAGLLRKMGATLVDPILHEELANEGIYAFRVSASRESGGTGEKAVLLLRARKGRLFITSDPKTAVAIVQPDTSALHVDWFDSLTSDPGGDAEAVELWLHMPVLLNGLERLKALGSARARLSRIADRLHENAIAIPPALRIVSTPFEKAMELTVSVTLPDGEVFGSTIPDTLLTTLHPGDALPEKLVLRVDAQRRIALDHPADGTGLLDVVGAHGVWDAFVAAGMILADEETAQFAGNMDALRMLTGLHPGRHLLDRLGERGAFGLWRAANDQLTWAAIVDTAGPEQAGKLAEAIHLGLSWGAYFASKNQHTLEVSPVEHTNALLAVDVRDVALGARATVLLTESHLVIARNPETAALIASRLGALEPRPVGRNWVEWSIRPSPVQRETLAAGIASTVMKPPREDESFTETAARAAVLGLLQQLIDNETGSLGYAGGEITLATHGTAPPLTAGAFGMQASETLAGSPARHKTRNAQVCSAILRTILSMQQSYRHLELGAFNGQGTGKRFAPTLTLLVNGRSESRHSLTRLWDKLYPPAEETEYSFVYILRGIARGAGAYGYRFETPPDLDLSREWKLLARPMRPRTDPVLMIDQTGQIRWKLSSRGDVSDDSEWQRWE